jgi:2-C-methyl-D-erythritol 4-phosphate cytidylyltransferase
MVSAIIVSGGKGKRMKAGINKQYIKLAGREIIARTLEIFQNCSSINEIVLVLPENEIEYFKKIILKRNNVGKLVDIVPGGQERQDSVYNGLKACSSETDIVLIHDGARPFVTEDIIKSVAQDAREYGASTAAVRVKDTIKFEDGHGIAESSLDRSRLWSIQTPQGFRYSVIMEAHEYARENNICATDDTALAELKGYKARLVEGSYYNIKITTPEDMILGEAIAEKIDKEEI